eukprot:Gb_06739 [translate_table: standard]
MLASGTERGVNTSLALGVPTRFVWPHGGRRVFLIGSFTRWVDTLPMSPVEGCSSVFQAICSLTPGCHQYKFIVDGDWRHDDQQPFMTDTLGNVNNVLFVREPDLLPTTPSLESSSIGAHMEVDHVPFQQAEAVQRISEVDRFTSRQRIQAFLAARTAYELLPVSGKVVVLDISLPVKQAFHVLYDQGISVAPLWDSNAGQFVGMLSASDFITILKELGSKGAILSEEELETHTIAAWKDEKMRINQQADGSGIPLRKSLVFVGPDDSLKDVAQKILQHEVATVPVLCSSAQDGSSPELLYLASLSGILKCICRHFKYSPSSLPLLQQPICSLPIGIWIPEIGEAGGRSLAMLSPDAPLSSAFSLLLHARVSAIPIVDDNGSLLDIYARSDITALAKDTAYARVRLDELTIHRALQSGQDGVSPGGAFGGVRCHMCLRSDTLQRVMERLAVPGVRRLICVEAGSNRVEGIISLSDIFNYLLN